MITLKNLAEKTGFSVSVVSRALNPRTDWHAYMSEPTRRLILKAARQAGFCRNRAAEFLKRGGTATVGVFLPDVAYTLTADLIFGISEVAAQEGFPLQIGFDAPSHGFRAFLRENMRRRHVGVISYPNPVAERGTLSMIREFRKNGGRLILLNTPPRKDDIPVIAIDDLKGGRLAAERLLERKCARYAVMTLPDFCRERAAGFEKRLELSGQKAERFGSTEGEMRRFFRFCGKPSAASPVGVFAATDFLAMRMLQHFCETGVKVGRDLLVIGYDDLYLTEAASPALTTVRQPFREEGRLAMRKLLRMIDGQPEQSELLSPLLVARDSA